MKFMVSEQRRILGIKPYVGESANTKPLWPSALAIDRKSAIFPLMWEVQMDIFDWTSETFLRKTENQLEFSSFIKISSWHSSTLNWNWVTLMDLWITIYLFDQQNTKNPINQNSKTQDIHIRTSKVLISLNYWWWFSVAVK